MAARRTSFHFPREAVAQLNAIRLRTYIDSNAEIIRMAVVAYDELLTLDAAGHRMSVIDRAGASWPFSPFMRLNYPGLAREALNSEAEAASDKAVAANFFFTDDVVDRLESIKQLSHIKSNADIIRVALSQYKELILVHEAGDSVVITARDGSEGVYSPFRPFRMEAPVKAAATV